MACIDPSRSRVTFSRTLALLAWISPSKKTFPLRNMILRRSFGGGPNDDWRGNTLNCLRRVGSNSEADSRLRPLQTQRVHNGPEQRSVRPEPSRWHCHVRAFYFVKRARRPQAQTSKINNLWVTNRGDIVVDPFLGSGSTLIAAEKTKRVCRGVELDPLYVDVIVRRYEAATGNLAVLAETGEAFEAVAARRASETATV
jgi:hypothetical protein